MDMQILYFLENLRIPFFDTVFSYVTMLGEETVFMLLALIVLWCVDKKWGYYLFFVGLLGTNINQFLKNVCRVARPWVRDFGFTIVDSAKKAATGYSFPSGHTQSATGLFGGIARISKNKALRAVLIALVVLVGFSRMYLGVHTPQDVLASWLIGLVLVLAFYPLFKNERHELVAMAGSLAIAVAFVVYTEVRIGQAAVVDGNLVDGLNKAYMCLGLSCSLPLIFYIDKRFICFPTKAVWWGQLIKCVLGIVLVVAIKEGLRNPILVLTMQQTHYAYLIRYFLMAIAGGVLWPMTFQWFSRLGKR